MKEDDFLSPLGISLVFKKIEERDCFFLIDVLFKNRFGLEIFVVRDKVVYDAAAQKWRSTWLVFQTEKIAKNIRPFLPPELKKVSFGVAKKIVEKLIEEVEKEVEKNGSKTES